MTTYYITRHKGAVDWLKAHEDVPDADIVLAHLDDKGMEAIRANDRVYGILPIPLAMEITRRGAFYFHVDVRLEKGERASELTKEQLDARGARIVDVMVGVRPKRKINKEKIHRVQKHSGFMHGFNHTMMPFMHLLLFGLLAALAVKFAHSGEAILSETWRFLRQTVVSIFPILQPDLNPMKAGNTHAVSLNPLWLALQYLGLGFFVFLAGRFIRSMKDHYFSYRTYWDKLQAGEGREALIINLSFLGAYANDPVTAADNKILDFKNAITAYETLEQVCAKNTRLPWQQNLRCLQAHLSPEHTLRVMVLTTDESAGEYDKFIKFLTDVFKQTGMQYSYSVERIEKNIQASNQHSAEDVLKDALKYLRKKYKLTAKDISIDITSGTVPQSVAGALMSVNSNTNNVYVDTNTQEIHVYDTYAKVAADIKH